MDFVSEIEAYTKSFIDYNKVSEKSENTIKTYSDCLRSFVEFCYTINNEVSIKTLQQKNITDYLVWLDDNYRNKAHNKSINRKNSLSSSTKSSYITILKVFFKYITKNNNELIDLDNLLKNYKINVKKSQKLNNFFKKAELDQIMLKIDEITAKKPSFKNYRNALLAKLMLKSGLRISEALGLKFGDFQESDEGDFYDINILAKGGEYQTAYIFKAHIQKELEYLISGKGADDYVFSASQESGKTAMTRQNAYTTLNKIYKKSGILSKQGCHILRHSFAMRLVEENTNLGTIQKALRHKRIQTTMIYAEASSDMIKKELKRVF